ncbi:IclR family transcriptional regulator [Actinoplanes sp. NPDC051851]|uniref:IclR family transcriptional regulator n=1 Tax=Actinoplanes sp. NPDC051851 TaxID=3154753 RepID=UPI00342426A8
MNAPPDVLGRAAILLRAISARERGSATTAELARATGIARPTAHRLLTALMTQGFVDRDPDGRWLLGPELYLLGTAAAARYDVTSLAQPSVRRLAVATGESAFFSVRRGDETVCLLREDGSFPIRSHVLHEGIRFPLGVASAGLAILAYLPATEVDRYLSANDLTVAYGVSHAPDRLRARIADTRRDGYALNPGLIVEGSWGMAAAVFDNRSRPVGALTLTGIESRFTPDRQPKLGRLLLDEAHRLTITAR